MARVYLKGPDVEHAWIACQHPERKPSAGMRYHLREQDNCRPCAIAWLAALPYVDDGEAKTILTERANRTMDSHGS